ncbi:MAG: germination lipoprotein GerS-related protein [Clostridium sp.]|nr:germination lipoprotein GerS-related protein [Clostridium sp.]
MNLSNKNINNKFLISGLIIIPLIIISVIIICRHVVVPTNEEIMDNLKNLKCYSSTVEYEFKNEKLDYQEKTKQYYDSEKGVRIEFNDEGDRVKVYKGGEIKVQDNDDEYSLDKDMDIIYPLAFLENIFSNSNANDIEEIKPEWSDEVYLKINIEYNSKNKHLNNAEFYVNKNTGAPVLLKIYDINKKERIILKYTDFKEEKQLEDELF